jgi:hypothetical protein
MDDLANRERPDRRARTLALILGAFVVANALALLIAGPARQAPAGHLVRGVGTLDEPEAARGATALIARRAFVFVAFNGLVVAGVGFSVLARRLEDARRRRLGLPDWLDEADVSPHLVGRGDRPRAGS